MDDNLTLAELDTLPSSKVELMDRIHRSRQALEKVINPLGPEQLSSPGPAEGWAIKDHLAHLAAWEQFMLRHYIHDMAPHEAMGVDEETMRAADETGINDILYSRNKHRPIDEVLAEFHHSYQEVLSTLEAMSFDDLMKARFLDDPEKRPTLTWVAGNTYGHYAEHTLWIKQLLEDKLKRTGDR
jgi:uncharacterized protein (TIGR03083 family)